MTDAAKATVFSTSYEPFGRPWGTTGSLASTERYTFLGERNDTVTGQTYLRARQYDPSTGRFTSLDPVLGAFSMPQTLNRYPYVVNNPTTYTDPTGEFVAGLLAVFLLGAVVLPGVVCAVVMGDLDCAMMALSAIPVLGDLVASTYFVVKGLNACFGWWDQEDDVECSPGWIALDALGFLPFVPSLGLAARATRAANQVGNIAPIVGRTNNLFDISDAAFWQAYHAGAYGNMPIGLARGRFAHEAIQGTIHGFNIGPAIGKGARGGSLFP